MPIEDLELLEADEAAASSWSDSQKVVQAWWGKWSTQYWHQLVPRTKWAQEHRALKVGDICCLRYGSSMAQPTFRLCRVIRCMPDEDGIVRTVEVGMRPRHKNDNNKKYIHKEMKVMSTAVQRLALLLPQELQDEWMTKTVPEDAERSEEAKDPETQAEEQEEDQESAAKESPTNLDSPSSLDAPSNLGSPSSLDSPSNVKPNNRMRYPRKCNMTGGASVLSTAVAPAKVARQKASLGM